jgi:hypothetical protein
MKYFVSDISDIIFFSFLNSRLFKFVYTNAPACVYTCVSTQVKPIHLLHAPI